MNDAVNQELSRFMQSSGRVLASAIATCQQADPEMWAAVAPLIAQGAELALEVVAQPTQAIRVVVLVGERRLHIGSIPLNITAGGNALN